MHSDDKMLGHLFLWRRYPGLLVDLFYNHSSSLVPIRHSSTSPNLLDLLDSTCTPFPVPTWLRTPFRPHLRNPNSEHFPDSPIFPIRTFLFRLHSRYSELLVTFRTSDSRILDTPCPISPHFFLLFFFPLRPPGTTSYHYGRDIVLGSSLPELLFGGTPIFSETPMGPLMNLL